MFKEMLLSMVENHLDEDTCGAILASFESSALGSSIITVCRDFEESEHPRHDDGRFAPGGSGRPHMRKSEAQKWDDIGHSTPKSKELTKKKGKLRQLQKKRDSFFDSKIMKEHYQKKIVELQREIANLERETKHERRTDLENKVGKRILRKQVKEFHDIEDEIDYMEERYGDRDAAGQVDGGMKWPGGKKGEKAKQKYEALIKRRAELDEEIEWDKVEEDED